MGWELARDEGFRDIAASGVELAERASAHSVHADPAGLAPGALVLVPLQRARRAQQRGPHAHRAGPGRGRGAAVRDRLLPALGPRPLRGLAPHGRRAPRPRALPRRLHLRVGAGAGVGETRAHARRHGAATTLQQYRDRYAQYKADPALQRMHAAAPWIMVWDDHEVENDYANDRGQALDADFPARRAAAYQAYWEHLPFPGRAATARRRHAHLRALRLGTPRAHPCRRRPPVPRPPGLPARRAAAAPTRSRRRTARRCSTRGARCSARSRSAGSPTAGAPGTAGTCSRSRR